MLYRAEGWSEKRMIVSQIFQATHPKQAVRRIRDALETKGANLQFLTVYILNEEGQMWMYGMKKKNSKYRAMMLEKGTNYLPRNLVQMVFAGNRNIREVVG